jgi:hypothetical protein
MRIAAPVLILASLAVACGHRPAANAPPKKATPPAAGGKTIAASGCGLLESAVERLVARGSYGRALLKLRAVHTSSCAGAERLSKSIDKKRKELGLTAALPSPALRLELSKIRALRAAGHLEEARGAVERLLSASPGQAFILAEAGLVAHAHGGTAAAGPYFEQAMLALGPPELEPAAERYRDFYFLAFGAHNGELWSCNARARVTDTNTLEPLYRIPIVEGCRGLDVADGLFAVATTSGSLDPGSFAETPFPDSADAVRFSGKELLSLSERPGSDGLFGMRSLSGEPIGPLVPVPELGGVYLAVTADPEGSWAVGSSLDAAWALQRGSTRAPLALGGPAVAVRGAKAVVIRDDRAELIELPSKRRVRSVPLEGCPPSLPPTSNLRWALVSRDGATVALLRCSSITIWRWAEATAKALTGDPGQMRSGGGELEPFALSPDGSLVVRASSGMLEVFDTRTGRELRKAEPPSSPRVEVTAAPSGALALTTGDRTFVLSEAGTLEGEVSVTRSCRAPEWYGSEALLLRCERDLLHVSRSGGRVLSQTRLQSPANRVFAVPPERVVVARAKGSQVLHLGSGKVELELPGSVDWVSPDGKLAVASELASDGTSTLALLSLSAGTALSKARDRFVIAVSAAGGALVLGRELWYFAAPAFRATRLAEEKSLVSSPRVRPTSLRFSADQRAAVVGFENGSIRRFELATKRELSGPVDTATGLVWSGNRGYRRSDGKHVVTIESAPSGEAFSVTTTSGAIEFLGEEPAALPFCSFGVAQFPFVLCRSAVLGSELLRELSSRGEWYGG